MNLTIMDLENNEPLIVLSEDEYGMKVVGGDPSMIDALGLSKMRELKEVADFINSSGDPTIQAMFDEGYVPDEKSLPELEELIRPALQIIKDLISKVEERKASQTLESHQDAPEAKILESADAEIIMDAPAWIYVSIDGDNIGNAVARAEATDNEAELKSISQKINAGQQVFTMWAQLNGGEMIEQGGDEGLCKVPATAMEQVEELRQRYLEAVGATATVGIGERVSQATKARELGKLTGKNKTVVFDESTEQELELRLEQEDMSEPSKIRNALSVGSK